MRYRNVGFVLVTALYVRFAVVKVKGVKLYRVIIKEVKTGFRVRIYLLYCVRKEADMSRPRNKPDIRKTV